MAEYTAISNVVVIGHGVSLSMMAALLGHGLTRHSKTITVVQLPDMANDCDVVVSGPEFTALCDILKLPIEQVISHCVEGFSLGTCYHKDQRSWFVPFGHMGLIMGAAYFDQGILRALKDELLPELQWQHLSLAAQAVSAGKFAIAGPKQTHLQGPLKYAVTLNRQAYRTLLQQIVQQAGIKIIATASITPTYHETGAISDLTLDNGQIVKGDFFIDCSVGDRLTQKVVDAIEANQPSIITMSWVQNTPVKHQFGCQHLVSTPWGWIRQTQAKDKWHFYTVFESTQWTASQVESWLSEQGFSDIERLSVATLSGEALAQPMQQNYLAVGKVVMDLGELVFSELVVVQQAIITLLDHFPINNNWSIHNRIYNRAWQVVLSEAEAFIDLHSSHFMVRGAKTTLAKNLVARFGRLGSLPTLQYDIVSESQWFSLMLGLGISPELPCHYLSNISDTELQSTLNSLRQYILNIVNGMPSYVDFCSQVIPNTLHCPLRRQEAGSHG